MSPPTMVKRSLDHMAGNDLDNLKPMVRCSFDFSIDIDASFSERAKYM